MSFTAFHATTAEGALAGIVAPIEFAFAGLVGNSTGSAPEFADGAAGAKLRIEPHQAPEARAHVGPCRKAHRPRPAPQVLPQHGQNIHSLTFMKAADEVARPGKISVLCK